MSMAVRELERVLKNEVAIYHQLYDCEEEKGRAIIARDGALIERLSREQEELMRRLGALERERLALIDEYVRENRINELPGNVTLRQIVAQMVGHDAHGMPPRDKPGGHAAKLDGPAAAWLRMGGDVEDSHAGRLALMGNDRVQPPGERL